MAKRSLECVLYPKDNPMLYPTLLASYEGALSALNQKDDLTFPEHLAEVQLVIGVKAIITELSAVLRAFENHGLIVSPIGGSLFKLTQAGRELTAITNGGVA
jgi:hypothetical protein